MKGSIHRDRLMKRFDQMTAGTAFFGRLDLVKDVLEEIVSPTSADVPWIRIAKAYLDAERSDRQRMLSRRTPGQPWINGNGTRREVEAFFEVVAKLSIVDEVIGIEDRIARMQAFADEQLASLSVA